MWDDNRFFIKQENPIMQLEDVSMRPWEKNFSLPATFNMVSLLLDRHIEQGRGARVAIHCPDRKVTYREVYELTNRAGNAFSGLGLKKGDRVMMMMYDSPEFVAVYLGAMKIGAIPIPINILSTASDLEYFLQDSRASLLVVEKDLFETVKGIVLSDDIKVVTRGQAGECPVLSQILAAASPSLEMCQTDATDHSYWLYSSGTTGRPKGIVHLHKDMVYSMYVYGHLIGYTPDDISYGAPKLFFSYGLNMGIYLPFLYCASVVLVEDRPLPASVLDNLQKYKPTKFFSVPTSYAQLLQYIEEGGIDPDLSSLRICVSAGEALPAVIYKRWLDRFHVEILDGLGSTEVSMIFITSLPGDVKIGRCGKLLPGYEAKLIDEIGKDVPQGTVGDLWIRGKSVTPGYWNKPEQNRKTFRDGWIKTGDCCILDGQGYFLHCGRSEDTLKVSGMWVSPLEVESVLMEHDAVAQCAVVAKRDENDLVKIKAVVVPKNGYTSDDNLVKELQNFVKSRLAPYKYPRWVEFADRLPVTATGKVQRYKLREV